MAQIEFRTSQDGQPVAFQADTGALPVEPQEPEVAASTPSRRTRRKGASPSSLEVGQA